MTFKQWVQKYNGRKIDWDDVSPYQCVDLAKCYLQEVWGVKTKGRGTSVWGDAKDYYLNFENKSWGGYKKLHAAGFVRIKNTKTFIPMKGDIVVWNNGKHGHIGVANGDGDTKDFYSYDQNWGGKYMHLCYHTYSFFLGVLRPPRTVKAAVNIRAGAGVEYKRLGELKKGTRVTVYELDSTGKWARIGKGEWISYKYIREL